MTHWTVQPSIYAKAGCLALTLLWMSWLASPQYVVLAVEPEGSSEETFKEQPLQASDRDHWSFAPLKSIAPPVTQNVDESSALLLGAIDAFIVHDLAPHGLHLSEPASPEEWLRRITFDVTGLPPTREAMDSFRRQAHEPDAYERVIDKLLASPAHGEHVAQSWLDLARFAETDGFEHDKSRPDAWRFRNWVIEAFNGDMPYDRFMQLQLAGDLIDKQQFTVGTMFCLSGPDMPDLNDQVERRHNLLNEMTSTVGSVFLGLQMGCAACHDHKYDPISQADFYRLRGILETGVGELTRDKPWTEMQAQSVPAASQFYVRGDHRRPSQTLERTVPRIAATESAWQQIARSNEPRLALAEWLASTDNPLPARAMANRIWQSHFGRGLAGTPSDLGLVGLAPTHTALLDFLATELMKNDWSLKHLHRSILLSATYRQQSHSADEPNASLVPTTTTAVSSVRESNFARSLKADPENRLLGRYPRRRLTGEMLRDAMLQAAGDLNRQSSGPSVMPPLPDEMVRTLLPGQWKTSSTISDHHRRSIYIFARRNLRYPIFDSFDRPDAGASCPERGKSTTATQSLLMFNSAFSLQIAESISDQAIQHSLQHSAQTANPSDGGSPFTRQQAESVWERFCCAVRRTRNTSCLNNSRTA